MGGDDLNLIFLPGASGNTTFWQPVIQRLLQDDSSIVVAYPSFGDYPDDVDVQNFEDLQDYVLNQIQQSSVVVAQSMGGIFAVQAALQKAEQVQALVLVATSGGIDLSPFRWRIGERIINRALLFLIGLFSISLI